MFSKVFAILLIVCSVVTLVTAYPQVVPQECQISDPAVAGNHMTHVTGMNLPGEIHLMNFTLYQNVQPGVTDYEPYYRYHTYQVNGFNANLAGCYFDFVKVDERLPGHWVFSTWIAKVLRQTLITLGSGNPQQKYCYDVVPTEPILFDQLGAAVLEIESCNIGTFAETTVFNVPLPDGSKFTVLSETLQPTPRAVFSGVFDEFHYLNGFLGGDANGFPEIDTILRNRLQCSDYDEDSQVARACRAFEQFAAGNVVLANDPLAAAAGAYHEVYTYIEPEAPAAKQTAQWPPTALAKYTYSALMNGEIEGFENGIDYVRGMPVSSDEHNTRRQRLNANME